MSEVLLVRQRLHFIQDCLMSCGCSIHSYLSELFGYFVMLQFLFNEGSLALRTHMKSNSRLLANVNISQYMIVSKIRGKILSCRQCSPKPQFQPSIISNGNDQNKQRLTKNFKCNYIGWAKKYSLCPNICSYGTLIHYGYSSKFKKKKSLANSNIALPYLNLRITPKKSNPARHTNAPKESFYNFLSSSPSFQCSTVVSLYILA